MAECEYTFKLVKLLNVELIESLNCFSIDDLFLKIISQLLLINTKLLSSFQIVLGIPRSNEYSLIRKQLLLTLKNNIFNCFRGLAVYFNSQIDNRQQLKWFSLLFSPFDF